MKKRGAVLLTVAGGLAAIHLAIAETSNNTTVEFQFDGVAKNGNETLAVTKQRTTAYPSGMLPQYGAVVTDGVAHLLDMGDKVAGRTAGAGFALTEDATTTATATTTASPSYNSGVFLDSKLHTASAKNLTGFTARIWTAKVSTGSSCPAPSSASNVNRGDIASQASAESCGSGSKYCIYAGTAGTTGTVDSAPTYQSVAFEANCL